MSEDYQVKGKGHLRGFITRKLWWRAGSTKITPRVNFKVIFISHEDNFTTPKMSPRYPQDNLIGHLLLNIYISITYSYFNTEDDLRTLVRGPRFASARPLLRSFVHFNLFLGRTSLGKEGRSGSRKAGGLAKHTSH